MNDWKTKIGKKLLLETKMMIKKLFVKRAINLLSLHLKLRLKNIVEFKVTKQI